MSSEIEKAINILRHMSIGYGGAEDPTKPALENMRDLAIQALREKLKREQEEIAALKMKNDGSGCKACPVNERGCDAQYRGSRCAVLRAEHCADYDPQTNADCIRNMTDEELAEVLVNASFYQESAQSKPEWNVHALWKTYMDRKEAIADTINWLQEPREL